MALPTLTPEQRANALAKAGAARKARAEVKAKLKAGAVTVADCLSKAGSDDILGKMKVSAMLEALPGMGKVRAKKLMEELEIADTRRLKGLGEKQRAALLERLGK